ncbi:MAG: AI-2E family transporter [Gemmatimonadota bacterium]|nr:AI-2E family transporter [Gemmatimonadota bacterium]
MVFDQLDQNPGLRFLFTLAVAVIVIQGLRFAQPVLLPIAVALFLAVICLPLVFWLKSRGVPQFVAILATVLAVVSMLGLLILIASLQLPDLVARVQIQIDALEVPLEGLLQWFSAWWPFVEEVEIMDALRGLLDLPLLAAVATGATTWALSFLSTVFLVLLILAFALGEAAVLPHKLRAIAGDGIASDERMQKVVDEVQGYLVIKTLVSIATGVLLGTWTWIMGIELPILLGLIAFALNYVPTIGSVIASVPALLLALIDVDPQTAAFVGLDLQSTLIVGAGYLTVNIVFGNWLEPTLMGRRLGLSTLVVILSLVFWGWLWGPLGALLSVPLTMIVKIMLENTKDLKWIAILLDKNAPGPLTGGEAVP